MTLRTKLTDVTLVGEDFTDVILLISDTYGDDVKGGNRIIMEDDKVADMVLMIPNEDFSDETVAIGDSYGDDVRGDGVGAGHGG